MAHQEAPPQLMRVVMVTLTLSSMSVLMFLYALPEISREFQLDIAQVSWLSSGYGLIYAIGTVIYGKLADRYPLKNIITYGFIVFAIGSFIGLFSLTFWGAFVGRCLQAIGAATIPAVAMLVPVRFFPLHQRGKALGMIAVGLALGNALGPVVSTLLVGLLHWRWLFVIPLLTLFTLPYYRKYLREEASLRKVRFDWLGSGLFAVMVSLCILGATYGSGWLMVSLLPVLLLFLLRIYHAKHPFIQPELLANLNYVTAILLSFLINGIGISLHFLIPFILTEVHQLPTFWIGFVMVPAATASALLARKGGELADRKGNLALYMVASSLLILCLILLSTFIGSSPWWLAGILVLGNVGQSFMMVTMSNSVSQILPATQVGVGMGVLQMLTFISHGVGTAIYSRVVDTGTMIQWNPMPIPSNGWIYSNLFLFLAGLHVLIFLAYYFRLGGKRISF